MAAVRFVVFTGLVLFLGGARAFAQGYAPDVAVGKMSVAEGLQVKLFASEPEVRQAIFVKCDDRGRLWTIQYLQYPNPAGLKRVKIDRWSRTLYDRVPKPPPHGPRGADKITILEDVDGDGTADKVKDFVDGLNLVTGVAFGQGGVFVLNVPYLLFYPDHDRDDVPDADPEVLLTGFGMEDAQSMSNHLTWGPDGWLYGVNGSTSTCHIRGIEFQQGVWRYHPITKQFELFCEGGSNCYGLTFDENGELFYSTNGGPFVHAVQGGYFFKSLGKHGPIHNLYAYHYFPNLECDQVPGGPPTGGTIYLGDSFPQTYRDKFVAGNFLGHTASWWRITPQGSTVKASFGGVLLDSHDTWFGPTDMCLGPDGSMYVSDFHDQRTAHPDPDANWDLTNGRIYKIESVAGKKIAALDIAQQTSQALVDLLSHANRWYANRARSELAYRRDSAVLPRLKKMALQPDDGPLALQGLWTLNVIQPLDESLAAELLAHPYPHMRFWTVRLLGDNKLVSPSMAKRLADLASRESSPVVLAQLAATAKRLSAAHGLPIVQRMLDIEPQITDARIPWLLWWALEDKAITDTDRLLEMFVRVETWQSPAWRDNALRLIRRWAAEGSAAGYDACLRLLRSAPEDRRIAALDHLRMGLAERAVGFIGIGQGGLYEQQAATAGQVSEEARQYELLTDALRNYLGQQWQEEKSNPTLFEMALRIGVDGAYEYLRQAIVDADATPDQSVILLGLLREFGQSDAITLALPFVDGRHSDAVTLAALSVLARFDSQEVTEFLLTIYLQSSPPVRSAIRNLLFSRPRSARSFLELVEQEQVSEQEVPVEQLRQLAIHKDKAIDALVLKHWGNMGPGTTEEKLATMRRYSNDLRAASGDPARGKILFGKHCGICHQLHGEGNKIGPDLTTANRNDQAALLANMVDPSAVIRREFLPYVVLTDSGRMVTGLLAEQDAASITILDAKNQRIKIPRDEVEELHPSEISLMPEKILEPLSPQELRDLFSYLAKP